jgi:hypothetical protein
MSDELQYGHQQGAPKFLTLPKVNVRLKKGKDFCNTLYKPQGMPELWVMSSNIGPDLKTLGQTHGHPAL